MIRTLLLLAFCVICQPAPAADAGCRATEPLRIRVRFAGEAPREVLIESSFPYGFRLVDATSGDEIWSASPDASATQRVAGMDSSFGGSITAVHLDADGVHDRLYAGDRAGRLWRFDLRAGARPSSWIQATVLAELGVPGGGRGLVAAPDVTLIETQTGAPWINIAIGTANTAAPRNDHRFYVLRDSIADRREAPLVEADLERLSPPAGVSRGNARGYYLALGSAQVLAQALTLNGRIHFVAVESARNLLAACAAQALPVDPVALSVTVLRAEDGTVEPASPEVTRQGTNASNLRRPLANPLPASTGVTLATTPADASGRIACLMGTEALPECFLDTRPRRSWWRREDAD